jgi:hypothetical protein
MRNLVLDLPDMGHMFESFFHSWPTEPKPPIESFPIIDPDVKEGERV